MTLVVGATGATGRWLVEQLLARGHHVKVIVRSPAKLPKSIRNNNRLSVIRYSLRGATEATGQVTEPRKESRCGEQGPVLEAFQLSRNSGGAMGHASWLVRAT